MQPQLLVPAVVILVGLISSPSVLPQAAAERVGEFSIRRTVLLTADQRLTLRKLVDTNAAAAGLLTELRREVEPILRTPPTPLESIDYEGLVNTDPRRIATVEKLRQMEDVSIVMQYWQATDDPAAAAWLRQVIAAWAKNYVPNGNDVNENKFYPLLVAYGSLRESFESPDQDRIDQWLQTIARLHHDVVVRADDPTNRYTKSVRLLAVTGRILDQPEWVDFAARGVQSYVSKGLRPDGTSLDLERRDSLTYHASGLRPMVEMAMMFPDQDLYRWQSPDGSSIEKSVNYLIPFVDGSQTHREWVDTKVGLDRRRAAAGLEAYRTGRLYDPADALPLLREAAIFDPALMNLVRQVGGGAAGEYEDWTSVVNAAIAAGDAS